MSTASNNSSSDNNNTNHQMGRQTSTSSAAKSETFDFTYSHTPNAGNANNNASSSHNNNGDQQQQKTPQKEDSKTSNKMESLVDIDVAGDEDDENEQVLTADGKDGNKTSVPEASLSGSLGILPPNLAAAADAVVKVSAPGEEEKDNANKKANDENNNNSNNNDNTSSNNNVVHHHGTGHSHGKGFARRIRSQSGMRTVAPPKRNASDSNIGTSGSGGNVLSSPSESSASVGGAVDGAATATSARGKSNDNNNGNDDDSQQQQAAIIDNEEMQVHWSFSNFETAKSNFLAFNLGVASEQGLRRTMEDQHIALIGSAGDGGPNMAFFAVYDGHAGTQCAEFLRDNLHSFITSHPTFAQDPESAVAAGVLKAEEEFIKKSKTDKLEAGSTVALAILVDNKTLVIGNVGDSEIVLSNKGEAVLLTTKHHLSCNKDEEARIKAAGGRIHNNRVGHPKFNPALLNIAVSRAVGDAGFKLEEYTDGKQSGLIANAQTRSVSLTPEDEFIVLACDGLWDVITYQDCVDLCKDCLNRGLSGQEISAFLADEAMRRQSSDNITCMFVEFRRPGLASGNSRSTSVNVNNTSNSARGGPTSGRGGAAAVVSAENSSTEQQQAEKKDQGETTTRKEEEEEPPKKPKISLDNWDYDGEN